MGDHSDVYLHGLSESDWQKCWNIGISGSLSSAEYVRSVSDAKSRSVREISIAELRNDPRCLQSFADHRTVWYVWAAAILRGDGKVGEGISPYLTRWKTDAQKDDILLKSERELACEEVRRAIAPDAASRLCSLFLAEEDGAGRSYVQHVMEARNEQFFILRVRISASLRSHKADAHWFEEYASTGDMACLENYWKSMPDPNFDTPQWEHLLEGAIVLCEQGDDLQAGLKRLGIRGMKEAQNLPKITEEQ